jgi:hypothetical protein
MQLLTGAMQPDLIRSSGRFTSFRCEPGPHRYSQKEAAEQVRGLPGAPDICATGTAPRIRGHRFIVLG